MQDTYRSNVNVNFMSVVKTIIEWDIFYLNAVAYVFYDNGVNYVYA